MEGHLGPESTLSYYPLCLFLKLPMWKYIWWTTGNALSKRKTLDPLYQQQLQFEESPEGKVLQVTREMHSIWHIQLSFIGLFESIMSSLSNT